MAVLPYMFCLFSFFQLPEFTADLQALGRLKIDASFFKKFDYGNAAV